jgi:Ca2+-binding RTX toxin-like protein
LADGITGDENISGLASGSTVVVNADNNNDADILTLSFADNTGASDVVNYTMTQAATDDYAVLAIAGAETVNLTINEATATATVYTGTLGLTLTSDGTTTRAITLNVSGTEALTIDTAIGATTITTTGLSGAFIMTDTTGSALAQTFTTGSGADTIYGGAGIDTIDTGSGADSIVAGTGADVITGGLGADTIDGGAGSDSITLTEGTASVDRVTLNYSGGGTEVDTITGFTTTSTGDNIAISYGGMNLTNTSGLFTSTTSLVNHAGTAIAAAAASTYLRITGAATLETATVLGLGGATFANTDAVEDALEAGGSHVITGSNAAFDVLQNTFAVVYSDGTDTYLALARAAVQTTDDLDFEAGNLVVKNIAKIVGVTSIGSTTFAAGNFDFIA